MTDSDKESADNLVENLEDLILRGQSKYKDELPPKTWLETLSEIRHSFWANLLILNVMAYLVCAFFTLDLFWVTFNIENVEWRATVVIYLLIQAPLASIALWMKD